MTPWQVTERGSTLFVGPKGGIPVCEIALTDALGDVGDPYQDRRNAHLFCAARELREALEFLVSRVPDSLAKESGAREALARSYNKTGGKAPKGKG